MANYGKFINSILNPLIEYGYQYEVSKRQFGVWYISFFGNGVSDESPKMITAYTTHREFYFSAGKYQMNPVGFSLFRKLIQDKWTKAHK